MCNQNNLKTNLLQSSNLKRLICDQNNLCQCYIDYKVTQSSIKMTISLKHQSDLNGMILGTRACF